MSPLARGGRRASATQAHPDQHLAERRSANQDVDVMQTRGDYGRATLVPSPLVVMVKVPAVTLGV